MPEGVKEVPKSPDLDIIEKCGYVLDIGYDASECGAGMLMSLTDEQFAALVRENNRRSLGLVAANSLIPPTLPICTDDADLGALRAYSEKLSCRLEQLGVKLAILGSGQARHIPDGMDKNEGYSRLSRFMNMFAEVAMPHGVRLAIEPLNRFECNVFNTVPESGDFARALGNDGVCLLADSFHMSREGSDPRCVCDYADKLVHCHISEPGSRTYPGSPKSSDLTYNVRFAEALKDMHYDGAVTVECGFDDFNSDAPAALAHLKKIFA